MTDVTTPAATSNEQDDRPGLVMIANCMAPYRANLHAVIAAGIPEFKLHTLITHGPGDFDWQVDVPESIHASYWYLPGDSPTVSPFRFPAREWRKGGQLIEYLKAHDARAVICLGYRYLSYLRVIDWCHKSSLPLFYHNDSNIRTERKLKPSRQFGKNLIYRWWMPRVAGVFSMGELGDQFFLKYGAQRDRLYHVPCTPNYDRYAQVDPLELNRFRQKFGLAAERKYLLFSGRLVPMKRVDLLIDAFAAIAERRPDWDLLVVGDGFLREELQSRVPQALRNRVVWTGFLQESECVLAHHAAEVLVLPSDIEPWALVVQEAIAAGKTVVASDAVGAAYELVEDHVSGRIFPIGDVSALQDALLDVTAGDNYRVYQEKAVAGLADWRRRVDPASEVRRALEDARVLPLRGPIPPPVAANVARHNTREVMRQPVPSESCDA